MAKQTSQASEKPNSSRQTANSSTSSRKETKATIKKGRKRANERCKQTKNELKTLKEQKQRLQEKVQTLQSSLRVAEDKLKGITSENHQLMSKQQQNLTTDAEIWSGFASMSRQWHSFAKRYATGLGYRPTAGTAPTWKAWKPVTWRRIVSNRMFDHGFSNIPPSILLHAVLVQYLYCEILEKPFRNTVASTSATRGRDLASSLERVRNLGTSNSTGETVLWRTCTIKFLNTCQATNHEEPNEAEMQEVKSVRPSPFQWLASDFEAQATMCGIWVEIDSEARVKRQSELESIMSRALDLFSNLLSQPFDIHIEWYNVLRRKYFSSEVIRPHPRMRLDEEDELLKGLPVDILCEPRVDARLVNLDNSLGEYKNWTKALAWSCETPAGNCQICMQDPGVATTICRLKEGTHVDCPSSHGLAEICNRLSPDTRASNLERAVPDEMQIDKHGECLAAESSRSSETESEYVADPSPSSTTPASTNDDDVHGADNGDESPSYHTADESQSGPSHGALE